MIFFTKENSNDWKIGLLEWDSSLTVVLFSVYKNFPRSKAEKYKGSLKYFRKKEPVKPVTHNSDQHLISSQSSTNEPNTGASHNKEVQNC